MGHVEINQEIIPPNGSTEETPIIVHPADPILEDAEMDPYFHVTPTTLEAQPQYQDSDKPWLDLDVQMDDRIPTTGDE